MYSLSAPHLLNVGLGLLGRPQLLLSRFFSRGLKFYNIIISQNNDKLYMIM